MNLINLLHNKIELENFKKKRHEQIVNLIQINKKILEVLKKLMKKNQKDKSFQIFCKKTLAKFTFLSDKWNEEKKPLNISDLIGIKLDIRG